MKEIIEDPLLATKHINYVIRLIRQLELENVARP